MKQASQNTFPDFIIFGAGNYNSLGVLHAMARANKEVFLLIIGEAKDRQQGNLIGYSKHAKNLQTVSDCAKGVDWLIANHSSFPEGTIIYPTGDSEEKALDENFDKLRDHFIFPNCAAKGGVSKLMDKHLQSELAAKAGIRTLRSQYSNTPQFSFAKVEYPCMVKPLNSTAGSKGDMRVCENEEELRKALSEGRHTKDFIVQQYIQNEADLLFLGIAQPNGEVDILALVKKPGVAPTGEYTHAVITNDVDAHLPEKKEVIEFLRSLNYTGPFSIEFGLEKGKNYFFEINLRNDGTSHYPLKAGVNIPLNYYNALRDINSTTEATEVLTYDMIDEVADLRRVLGRELGLGKWLKTFRKAGSYRFYDKGDYPLLRALIPMFISRSSDKLLRILKIR